MKKDLVALLGGVILISAVFAEATDDTATRLGCRFRREERVFELVRIRDGSVLDKYTQTGLCEEAIEAAHGGVVCIWFTPDMPVGPEGWNETGWRPMNIETKVGLGRRPYSDRSDCLSVTRQANGGVVCTNTGLGAKAANIQTGRWCGASSQLKYCLIASQHAKDFTVCSFPSDGTGEGSGWIRTHVSGECDYQSSPMTLDECNRSISSLETHK